jgi:soluble lytic murein transglycosylase-like protein
VTSGHVTIGSGESCSLPIEDEGLARLHASVHVEDDGTAWLLDERRAGGGVYVNDDLVPAAGRALKNGDHIYLGDHTTIRVSISARAPKHSRDAGSGSASSKGRMGEKHRPRGALVAAVVCAACLLGIVALGARAWGRRPQQARAQERRTDSARLQEAWPSPTATRPSPRESATPAPAATPAPSAFAAPQAPAGWRRLYMDIKDPQERAEYVEQKAQHIARLMSNREYAFNRNVVLIIQGYVDAYAARARSKSTRLWGEGLPSLYGRATRFAPIIIRAFDARGVPPVVGLYIVMIETEYHPCLESPVGAKGLFQFMPDTAREYGVDPADRCDVEKMAPAAAHYITRRIGEFGTDPMSVALGIAAYNRGPDSVRRDLSDVVNSGNSERSFWNLIANAEKLDHYFQRENSKYVPKFFAAAIVGEHPWDFGLDIRPLSTYTSPPAPPGALPSKQP